jgi:hypothetical protein
MLGLNWLAGGQNKGSSKLTEAERLDVRREIAAAAGVSVGNVSKVKRLKVTAHPELLQDHARLGNTTTGNRMSTNLRRTLRDSGVDMQVKPEELGPLAYRNHFRSGLQFV